VDIAEFVKARLAEDEAAAMAAASDAERFAGRANWTSGGKIVTDAEDADWAICDLSPFIDDECIARHVARHDPARALREVAAKRRMLSDLDLSYLDEEHLLKLLALPYSDHPDYRQKWAT
jgi:hypothetical protein